MNAETRRYSYLLLYKEPNYLLGFVNDLNQ